MVNTNNVAKSYVTEIKESKKKNEKGYLVSVLQMGGRIRGMWESSNQKCIYFIQLPATNNKLLVHEFW